MASSLLRVALTGGIATGKSHCLRAFAALGAPVIDADVLARDVLAPGTDGLARVVQRFGRAVLTPDGALDRAALGGIVFTDAAARRDLEAIVHPLVYDRIKDWFAGLDAAVGIADIPLLYETGRAADFDRVIVAACDRAEQKRRVMTRDGMSATEAELRLAAQMPIEEKRAHADYVIDTGGTTADTDVQVARVWEKLTEAATGPRG